MSKIHSFKTEAEAGMDGPFNILKHFYLFLAMFILILHFVNINKPTRLVPADFTFYFDKLQL